MPRLDRCDETGSLPQAANLHFARPFEWPGILVARADSRLAPAPCRVAVEHEDPFPGSRHDLVAPVGIQVDELEIVDRMQRRVGNLDRKIFALGLAGNVMNEDANPLPFAPVRAPGHAPLERRNHKLLPARPFHVAEAQTVQRRLLVCNRVNLPLALAVTAQPLQRARALGVGRPPARSQRKVDAAVAIDVMRLDADVIPRGRPANDVLLLPARVLVPDHGVLGCHDDVGLAVVIHVRGRHCIADFARVLVDLLGSKPWEIACSGLERTEEEEDDGHHIAAHDRLRVCSSIVVIIPPGPSPLWPGPEMTSPRA